MTIRMLLYLALSSAGVLFSAVWARHLRSPRNRDDREPAAGAKRPTPIHAAVGLVTNFFDTLGIGSFAPTTSIFKLLRLVPDGLIPGTLMVGHTLPTLAQAFIYITIIEVEMASLVLLIGAAALGSWLGAGVVSRWPKRQVQLAMGSALLCACVLMLANLLGLVPGGGAALGLSGWRLQVALFGNFGLGALMTIGVGAYAPSLVMFALLGMDVKAIFPIMMGSCALLMPVGGVQFVRRDSYAPGAALGLTLGGVPGVLLAAYLVKELPLAVLRWVVLAIVLYTAITMLRSSMRAAAIRI